MYLGTYIFSYKTWEVLLQKKNLPYHPFVLVKTTEVAGLGKRGRGGSTQNGPVVGLAHGARGAPQICRVVKSICKTKGRGKRRRSSLRRQSSFFKIMTDRGKAEKALWLKKAYLHQDKDPIALPKMCTRIFKRFFFEGRGNMPHHLTVSQITYLACKRLQGKQCWGVWKVRSQLIPCCNHHLSWVGTPGKKR